MKQNSQKILTYLTLRRTVRNVPQAIYLKMLFKKNKAPENKNNANSQVCHQKYPLVFQETQS